VALVVVAPVADIKLLAAIAAVLIPVVVVVELMAATLTNYVG
jgi:hypothetical protein